METYLLIDSYAELVVVTGVETDTEVLLSKTEFCQQYPS